MVNIWLRLLRTDALCDVVTHIELVPRDLVVVILVHVLERLEHLLHVDLLALLHLLQVRLELSPRYRPVPVPVHLLENLLQI